ncbi:permease [Russula earlei]|uniref:Permease n=1 Tax=Russula earlei TaxID=71964 RepID=A0ACC0TSR6_9AGAM|nr:permease [Russula earlei]
MAGRTEVIAILASGTSFNRWLRPYWVGGIFLATILWFANQYVIPNANHLRGDFEATYVDKNSSYNALLSTDNSMYIRIDSFSYAGILHYQTDTKRGGPFFLHRMVNNKLVKNIRADILRWDTATKKWTLDNALVRIVDSMGEKVSWHPTLAMDFNFRSTDLSRDKYTKDKLTTPELKRFIALEEMRGSEGLNELKVERYRRDATCVTVILLTIIGAVVAGRKVRGGSGVHLATGFITAALFIVSDKFSTIFSTKGSLPPILAAWIPNMIFVFVAYYLYKRAPK